MEPDLEFAVINQLETRLAQQDHVGSLHSMKTLRTDFELLFDEAVMRSRFGGFVESARRQQYLKFLAEFTEIV